MDFTQLLDAAAGYVPYFRNLALELFQPWRLYQIGGVLVLYAVASLLARLAAPRMQAVADRQTGLRARIAGTVHRRRRALIFVLLLWLIAAVMREVTWPSRSYVIILVATLVTAWLAIGVAARLIANPLARLIVTWGAWAWVTLSILGVSEDAARALDSAALSFGEQRLSLLMVVKAAILITALAALAGWLSRLLDQRLEAVRDLSPSVRVLAEKGGRILLFGFAAIMALNMLGLDLTSLTVLSGAIGLGLGFGLQKVVSNLVSGIILVLDKSIKPGDVISLGETFGWITSLGARYVSVVTRDGREYLIPNEDLITGQVVNWSHSSDLVRLDINFGVSYDSDPHVVRKVACAAAAGVGRVIAEPAPVCHITGFGESSIDFVLRFWIRDPSKGLTNIRGNVFLALWDALKAEGISIPFPRRDVAIIREDRT